MILEYPKRITLKDIARTANLSVAAVSMALRNHASLPASTIDRVKKIANELGYRPDPALSALAAHRTRMQTRRNVTVIACISDWSTRDGWLESPGARTLFDRASERAESLGYDLQHFWAREHGGFSPRLAKVLDARGIRSVILAPAEDETQPNEVDWSAFTVVSLEPPPLDARVPHVGLNHFSNVVRCWHELSERGISRVGFISRQTPAEFAQGQSLAAHTFNQSRSAHPFDRIPDLELTGEDEAEQIQAWLQEHKPQAIISSAPLHHVLTEELKLELSDSLSYISLDVTAEKADDVSGIDANMGIVGETVIDSLNQLQQRGITGQSASPVGTQVAGVWQNGTTLTSPPVLAKSG